MSLTLGLRLCIVICLASIGFAMYSEWSDLNLIEGKTDALSGKAIPLLEKTAQLTELQSGLEASLAKASSLSTPVELDALTQSVANLEVVFSTILSDVNDGPVNAVPRGVEVFGEMVENRKAIVAEGANIDRQVKVASALLSSLERRILVAQSEPQAYLVHGEGSVSYRDLDRVQTLGEMSGSIASLTILTRRFLDDYATRDIVRLRANIIAQINILTARLSRLNGSASQAEIAIELAAYRRAMMSEDGIFYQALNLDKLQDLQNATHARAKLFLKSADAWTSSQIQISAVNFKQSAQQTSEIVQRIRIVDLTFNLIMLLASFGIFWFMIERRIISRLSRLKKFIQDMSHGDLRSTLVPIGRDEITEVEKAVEQSRLNSFALQESNEELERFAYVAAHDLRAPLRAITNLVEWTEEDYEDELSQSVRTNLSLIRVQSERLSGHLSALLDYARAGQTLEEQGIFGLRKFVEDYRNQLHVDAKFDLNIEQDSGDFLTFPTPLKTILINLVGNAIKHHDKSSGSIALSCQRTLDWVEICVSDDGPGIPEIYQDKIFVLFQTLKSRDDIEGSGLGLALVQKLTQSLGGEVAVISQPLHARGTMFKVKLPVGDALEQGNPWQQREAA